MFYCVPCLESGISKEARYVLTPVVYGEKHYYILCKICSERFCLVLEGYAKIKNPIVDSWNVIKI